MRLDPRRASIAIALGLGLLSCTDAPTGLKNVTPVLRADLTATAAPQIVISQVYGGGGNAGATLRNDFIELFNPGTVAVSVAGWSVQYASAVGTTWQVTSLSGTIQPGGYYLVQEAVGAGGTTNLPTADATGTIAMSATAGKVWLLQATAGLSGACPTGGSIVDQVSFGAAASNCGQGTTGTLSNTSAAIRNGAGCSYTGSHSADFAVAAPTPRNSATATHVCPTVAAVASVTLAPNPASIPIGSTQTFTATARDAGNNVVATTLTWTSSRTEIATVDGNGVATAIAEGSATITATASNGVAGGATLNVTLPLTFDIVISQIYGGGGNSGAPYSHDYVELFNRGADPVDVTGWTVQYSSATSTTWSSTGVTTLPAGTIAPGKYYLVQLATQAAVGNALPTPNAIGTANMSGTAGKVVLTLPGIAPSAQCPTGTGIVDRVGYGSASNCATEWNGATATLSNTTAAFRKNDGCVKTGNITNDFIALPPNPHNGSSAAKNCDGGPPRPQSSAALVINELMADPANAESASWGEWFEVHNYGTLPINLRGWKIISGGTSQPDHTIATDVVVAAGGFAVLGRGADGERNGGVVLDYLYFVNTATTIWLDDSDYLMLVDTEGARADSVAWTSMAHGVTRALRNASLPHADANGSNWGYSTTVFGDGDYGTPGTANGTLADVAPIVSPNRITISGRVATDAPLPVGFESQLFATEATAAGVEISTTFTWMALTPDIATIDNRGVIHAVAPGTARFQVTAADGTSRIHTLTMITAVASTTAQYLDNAAFGEPTDDNPSDDFIIHRPQYTTSFNGSRGIPNWVAYDLNVTDIVPGQDRCNCFTFDPELEAAGFTRYNTADYTGAGAFLGPDVRVDRGHMVRSFDRTAGTLDNARTFYFSNVVPQFADLNQGPWANMENYLGDLAQNQNKEIYIYVGPAGSIGTVKNEGKINFPKYTWKIALILPRGQGLADVHDYRDVEDVIAVVMPNTAGVRNVDWRTSYVVTVDSVEKLTGYDFLSLLSPRTQRALETGTKPPLGSINGPYSSAEGSSVSMSAAASLDPNGTITSYRWEFGDGGVAAGASVSHTYANNGSYTVRMVVTDNDGLVDTVSTSTSVANVAPVVLGFNDATLLPGETYTESGSFTDPGSDVWSATVNYGDGGSQALVLQGKTFSLSHTYEAVGTFTARASVFDGDATGTRAQTVTVISTGEGVATLSDLVNQLVADGDLSSALGGSLNAKLDAASNQLARGNGTAAANQVGAFNNQVAALVKARRLVSADANKLETLASRIILAVER